MQLIENAAMKGCKRALNHCSEMPFRKQEQTMPTLKEGLDGKGSSRSQQL